MATNTLTERQELEAPGGLLHTSMTHWGGGGDSHMAVMSSEEGDIKKTAAYL